MANVSAVEKLTVEAERAGLRIEYIYPMECCPGCFSISILTPDGTVWAEATHETVEDIKRHIERWRTRSPLFEGVTVEPTEDQITEALMAAATREDFSEPGWRFNGTYTWFPETNARLIARACLILGVPVSDIVTIKFFTAIIDRILAIEKRVGSVDRG